MEGIDDRIKKMHPGRYLPPPIDHEIHYDSGNMPVQIKQPYLYITLDHIKVPTCDLKVMKAVQNRASRKLGNLDQYSSKNLDKKEKKPGVELKGFSIVEANNIDVCSSKRELRRAAFNYMMLVMHHHPMDYAPINVYAVIADKHDKGATTAELIKQFFAGAVNENAGQACRGQKPLTYDECLSR